MPFIKRNVKDNAQGQLQVSITSTATTIQLKPGDGAKLPDVPCILTVNERIDGVVTKYEEINVTDKTGDTLTVERGFGDTLPQGFDADDYISCFVVAEHIRDIQEEVESLGSIKANDSAVVHKTGTESISGVKTFSSSPIIPTPTTNMQPTTKQYVDDSILQSSGAEALVDKKVYMLGENCLINDSLFLENTPTFAESTLVQNIGDALGNTRITLPQFGTGISGSTLKLGLRKTGTPSANLSIRIETLDGSGNPTGSLIHANATASIVQGSLTTSLADTTITFAGSFSIPIGQKVGVVLNQVGDVVDSANFYGIGYVSRDTTTRLPKCRNGTAWTTPVTSTNNAHTRTFNTTGASTQVKGYRITSNINGFLNQVIKSPSCTATRAVIYADDGTTLLASASFVGNVATFLLPITNTTGYRVGVDSNGSSFTSHSFFGGGYPQNYSNINYISGAFGTASMGTVDSNNWYDILSITTSIEVPVMFNYISSSLVTQRLLSKTDSDFAYKLPTDYPRIANEAKNAGQSVIATILGLKNGFTGLSAVPYYVSSSPGLISTIAGTNQYMIGVGDAGDTTCLKIDGKNINKPITVGASPFNYVNNTGGPIQVKITGGTVNPIVINGVTVATATNHINTIPAGASMTVTYTVLPTITYTDL